MQSDYTRTIISRKSIGLMITMDGNSGTVVVSCNFEGREFASFFADAITRKCLASTSEDPMWSQVVLDLDDNQVKWLWGYEEQVDQFTTAFEEGDELI